MTSSRPFPERSNKRDQPDLIIIGGGASGLAAACIAARRGRRVLLLEARDRVGKKLLATGNGRCNLMNAGTPRYFGQADFAMQVLRCCPQEKVLNFFHGLGLNTTQDGDLVYPATLQAASVLETLRLPIEGNPKVEIMTGANVTAITPRDGGFTLRAEDGRVFSAARVIAAAGGPAQPRLSGSDSLFPALEALGHRLILARPSLTALLSDKGAVRGLKGLRLPAICTLCDEKGNPVDASSGEVLFAEDGISGVCVMQLSGRAGELLEMGHQPFLCLDFSPLLGLSPRLQERVRPQAPGISRDRVLSCLKERSAMLGRENMLIGALPRLLRERLEGLSLEALADKLSALRLPVRGLRGWDHAQVAAGGFDTDDVDPATLQSRLVPGLYLTGELLNVDGDCGGHNLLFAWASGILAGESI